MTVARELVILGGAEMELAEAFDWYEEQAPGLGGDFILAVDATFRAIVRNPNQFPVHYRSARRAVLRRFPYCVYFHVDEKRVVVLSVFHARRDPRHWEERAGEQE